ncbi:hypothetical protein QTJ16_004468 [Diplocarpon rosae]|uniref:HNH nuclease domain-containing protein n=1 Tax=Diplocarpon rosae TaxID=946125 RepID=A0AAD9WEF7_9HELO|nr:hypothetical protein QTJ16_004468 [Diplocarpon rosae]
MAACSQSQVTLRPSNNSDTSFSIPIPIPPSRPPPVPSSGLAFQYITIYHPHYPPGNNILLKLAALDTPTGGLQYGYLTTICGILAGNKWNGWLEGRDSHGGRYSSSTSPHIVLPPGGYDFFLEPSSVEEPYPVVPCFRQWRFPHMELPPGDWQNYSAPASTNKNFSPSNISMALELRDASCRISGFSEGTKVAHVIPKEEGEWHQANNMHVYQCDINRSLDTDLANLLLLRADLHINFDKPLFTIIPKSSGAGDAPQLVVHIVQQSKEYQHMYHNRPVLEWRDIPPEFLFARLAWTVFPWIEGFLSTGLKKSHDCHWVIHRDDVAE